MAQTAGVLAEPTDSGWPDARVARDMHGNLRNGHISHLNNLGNEIPLKLENLPILATDKYLNKNSVVVLRSKSNQI